MLNTGHYQSDSRGPLDIHLNVAILHIADRLFPCGFDVSETAPNTYEKLIASFDANRYVVYSGGSDTTIYADRGS